MWDITLAWPFSREQDLLLIRYPCLTRESTHVMQTTPWEETPSKRKLLFMVNLLSFSVQDLLLYRLVLCCNQNDSRLYDIYISSFYSAPLSVYMEPESQTVDVGKEVIIRCRIVGSPIRSVQWTRDGSLVKIGGRYSLLAKDILRIESVSRSDRGIFQCLVRNDRESAQGSSQLKIGESEPQFLSTFAEQVLEPGGRISLKW